MSDFTLVLGSKTLSSWSLRPWLFLRHHNVPFREVTVPLNEPDTPKRIREHSPSGRVPVLKHGSVRVWESLAICEYAAETLKLPAAWPADVAQRATARALACEMHAGFTDLRRELPFDCRRPPASQPYTNAAGADIARIRTIWRECRQAAAKSGEWLFGKFGIVDAMFAPVALRFHTYQVSLDGTERDYMTSVLNLPALREWLGASLLEPAMQAMPPAPVEEAPRPAAKPAARQPEPAHAAPPSAPLGADEMPPSWSPPPQPQQAPPQAAAAKPSSKKQVVSDQGGQKVTSYIIPD